VKDVLMAVCVAIMNSGLEKRESSHVKLALCNLVLQRIGSSTHISHEVFVFLYERMHTRYGTDSQSNLNMCTAEKTKDDTGKPPTFANKHKSAGERDTGSRRKGRAVGEMAVED
jgi:hypothetical protein